MVKSWFVPNKSPVLGLGRCQERLLRLLTFLLHLEKAHPQPQSARLHRCKQDMWRCIVVGATGERRNKPPSFRTFLLQDCIPNMTKHHEPMTNVGMENKEQDIKGWLILIHRQPMQEMIRDVLRERCVFAECSKGFWNKCFDHLRSQGGIVWHRFFFVMPICELRSDWCDWAYTPAGSELRHLKVHGDGWPHLRGKRLWTCAFGAKQKQVRINLNPIGPIILLEPLCPQQAWQAWMLHVWQKKMTLCTIFALENSWIGFSTCSWALPW